MTRRGWFAWLGATLISGTEAQPNDNSKIPARLRRLVVPLLVRFGVEERTGVGFIFGISEHRLYIATTNVLIRSGNAAADKCFGFFTGRSNPLPGRVLTDVLVGGRLALVAFSYQQVTPFHYTRIRIAAATTPGEIIVGMKASILDTRNNGPSTLEVEEVPVVAGRDSFVRVGRPFRSRGRRAGVIIDDTFRVIGLVDGLDDGIVPAYEIIGALSKLRYPLNVPIMTLEDLEAERVRKSNAFDFGMYYMITLLSGAADQQLSGLGREVTNVAEGATTLAEYFRVPERLRVRSATADLASAMRGFSEVSDLLRANQRPEIAELFSFAVLTTAYSAFGANTGRDVEDLRREIESVANYLWLDTTRLTAFFASPKSRVGDPRDIAREALAF